MNRKIIYLKNGDRYLERRNIKQRRPINPSEAEDESIFDGDIPGTKGDEAWLKGRGYAYQDDWGNK